MSATNINRDAYEYLVQGSSALERAERRSAQREQEFQEVAAAPRPSHSSAVRRALVAMLLTLVSALFMAGFWVLQVQASIQQNNITIASLKKDLTALEKEAALIELDIIYADNIEEARRVAISELGMTAPGPGQICYITLRAHGEASADAGY